MVVLSWQAVVVARRTVVARLEAVRRAGLTLGVVVAVVAALVLISLMVVVALVARRKSQVRKEELYRKVTEHTLRKTA